MSQAVISTQNWSSSPILDAVERYKGQIVDLDNKKIVSSDDLSFLRQSYVDQLKRNGLEPGDRVLIALGNSPQFIAVLTAVLACEASPLLVHYKTPPAELKKYAQRFGIRFLATSSELEINQSSILKSFCQLDTEHGQQLLLGEIQRDTDCVPGPELRGVPLHPTSGSTGLPKIALRPGFAAMEEARHYRDTMAIFEEDTIFAIPPMSHAYGYGVCVMLPLLSGANIITTANFNMKVLSQAVKEHHPTVLPCVPAHLDMMSFGGPKDFGLVRWLLTAGSMMPRRSADQFRDRTGIIACPLYGTTETGGISVATDANGDDVDGRVGPPMDGVEVRVSSETKLEGLPPGIGKLQVRSSSMMAGYLDDQGEITSPCVDGWFETGDLSQILAEQMIHLRGRTGEMINVLGLKVVPCEVEEAIAEIPGVKEVKVYSKRLASQVEVVKAAVAVESGTCEAVIRDYCDKNLVYYKRPSTINIVDALPRSPAGKILKDQLP